MEYIIIEIKIQVFEKNIQKQAVSLNGNKSLRSVACHRFK